MSAEGGSDLRLGCGGGAASLAEVPFCADIRANLPISLRGSSAASTLRPPKAHTPTTSSRNRTPMASIPMAMSKQEHSLTIAELNLELMHC